MNKTSFLNRIKRGIAHLEKSDINRYSDYYEEMIDDRIEEGLSEEEAVAALGNPADIIEEILKNTKASPKIKLPVWQVVLIVIGSPIWGSLLIAAAAIIFSLFITVWSIIVVFYAVFACFAIGALAGILGFIGMLISSSFPQAIIFLAAGFICAGLCIPTLLGVNFLTVQLAKSTKCSIIKIFNRRERYYETL